MPAIQDCHGLMATKKVSYYVMSTLDLDDGSQTNLMSARPFADHPDPVKMACRAIRKFCPSLFVSSARICFEEDDRTIYFVVQRPDDVHVLRANMPYAETLGFGFRLVPSIEHPRPADDVIGSFQVSRFVCEYLNVGPGAQSLLFASSGLDGYCGDKVKLVTLVVRELVGLESIPSFKFANDWSNNTVFILAPSDALGNRIKNKQYKVLFMDVSILSVNKLTLLDESLDEYISPPMQNRLAMKALAGATSAQDVEDKED